MMALDSYYSMMNFFSSESLGVCLLFLFLPLRCLLVLILNIALYACPVMSLALRAFGMEYFDAFFFSDLNEGFSLWLLVLALKQVRLVERF